MKSDFPEAMLFFIKTYAFSIYFPDEFPDYFSDHFSDEKSNYFSDEKSNLLLLRLALAFGVGAFWQELSIGSGSFAFRAAPGWLPWPPWCSKLMFPYRQA